MLSMEYQKRCPTCGLRMEGNIHIGTQDLEREVPFIPHNNRNYLFSPKNSDSDFTNSSDDECVIFDDECLIFDDENDFSDSDRPWILRCTISPVTLDDEYEEYCAREKEEKKRARREAKRARREAEAKRAKEEAERIKAERLYIIFHEWRIKNEVANKKIKKLEAEQRRLKRLERKLARRTSPIITRSRSFAQPSDSAFSV